MALDDRELIANLAGLDALEAALGKPPSRAARTWAAVWPKVGALALFLAIWQLVVWSGWKPEFTVPGPRRVLPRLWEMATTAEFWKTIGITMRRAFVGYLFSVTVGTIIGVAVARVWWVRSAVGSMITGIQTMPSVVWLFPAVIAFGLTETAIFFVVIMGAAPSVATGIIYGMDHVPPLLLRAGRMVGATGPSLYRHVIAPAVLPAFVAGLKQAWSFSWRSLMAGELLLVIANRPSIGFRLDAARTFLDVNTLYAWIIVIFIIGVLVDVLFTKADLTLRRRWGLIDNATN